MKPSTRASRNSVRPISQLMSRGLRNAPVKKIRSMCTPIAVRNTSAAQWWTCRTSSPPRTSKLISSVEAYAVDIGCPRSGS